MAQFNFGIFYLWDHSVQVESTDIVTPRNKQDLVQVLTRPDLSNEDGWIEVYWPTRKAPKQKVAAKLLLLGDNYKDLVEKRAAFLRDEDIWHMAVERRKTAPRTITNVGSKPKRKKNAATRSPGIISDDDETDIETSQVSVSNVGKTKMVKTARDGVLGQLKSSLLDRKPRTSTSSPSDEDETDIDTNVDLFDPPQASGPADHCDRGSEEGSVPMEQSSRNADMDQEVMEALKEIPTLVKCIKDLIATMQRMPPAMDTESTSSGSSSPAPEMIFLGSSSVQISKNSFKRLNRTRMSLFAQELAVLIFGRDVLASSSLTGKSGLTGTTKDQLDPEKLSALVDAVIAEFPGTNVSDVRAVIRRKCNNENFVYKKKL